MCVGGVDGGVVGGVGVVCGSGGQGRGGVGAEDDEGAGGTGRDLGGSSRGPGWGSEKANIYVRHHRAAHLF